jgi:hypothetical protein
MSRVAPRRQIAWGRLSWAVLLLLVPGLLAAGCAGNTPEAGLQLLPLATEQAGSIDLSPLPTATTCLPTDTPPHATAGMSPMQLVVLHTNDNWGETEPCG